MSDRRRFSPQFRAEAVQMVLATGNPIAQVARDLGINEGTLGNWVNSYRREHPEPDQPLTPVERVRVKEMEDEIRRLRMENEFLKKSSGLLRPDATVAERCALIEAEKATYDITFMCELLGVARSSFYAWRRHRPSPTAVRRELLGEKVARLFKDHKGRAGCRRIALDLIEAGELCSVGLIASIMRDLGLKAVQPRAYRRTTLPGEDPFPVPDLIERDFTAGRGEPGERLVGDITYLRTGQGWLYLATVIDLSTRMVVGWQMAEHMRTSLVTDALGMAIRAGHVRKHAIFHSDRGTQYTSGEFAKFCRRAKVRRSMGRTGVCWDNAVAESFFATLKNEMYYVDSFATRDRARFNVAEYIEIYYNRKRRHSSLGYRTPLQAFTDHIAAPAA